MSRPLVEVRSCREADLPAVVRMWEEMVELNPRIGRTGPAPTLENAAALLRLGNESPGCRVVVAVVGEEPAGMACLTHERFAPLHDAGAVHVTYLHVSARFRRRGVGHALVAAAAAYAEEVGAEHVVASVLPGLREPNRFFARLGFGPVTMVRATHTAALRRRLAAESHTRPVEDLLALRRSLRSRSRLQAAGLSAEGTPVPTPVPAEHVAAAPVPAEPTPVEMVPADPMRAEVLSLDAAPEAGPVEGAGTV